MGGEIAIAQILNRQMNDAYEERKQRLREKFRDPRVELVDRVADLRADLSRAVLLLEALLDICVAKGVFSSDELQTFIESIDWRDGVMDGKLDPSYMRSTEPRDEAVPKSPQEYLQKLADRDKARE